MGRQDLGRGTNRGCNNGRWFMTIYEPEEPKQNDVWFDMNFMILKYYDGANWTPFFGTGQMLVKKSSDEGIASTTTLQDDNDLFVANLESNSIYSIKTFIAAYGTTAADIKIAWSLGGSAALYGGRHALGPAASSTNNLDTNMVSGIRSIGASNPYGIEPSIFSSIQENFMIQTTGSTGSIQLRWAQNASSATRTTVTDASYIIYHRIQ